MDKSRLDKCIDAYPMLVPVLRGGSISRKVTREILGIDKYLMDELFIELLTSGAIVTSPSGYFRASLECIEYLGRNV
jgi:hypothetical protein